MQRLKTITSAENILRGLRGEPAAPNSPFLDPTAVFHQSVGPPRFSNPTAFLAASSIDQTPTHLPSSSVTSDILLDAALDHLLAPLIASPGGMTRDPSVPLPQHVALPTLAATASQPIISTPQKAAKVKAKRPYLSGALPPVEPAVLAPTPHRNPSPSSSDDRTRHQQQSGSGGETSQPSQKEGQQPSSQQQRPRRATAQVALARLQEACTSMAAFAGPEETALEESDEEEEQGQEDGSGAEGDDCVGDEGVVPRETAAVAAAWTLPELENPLLTMPPASSDEQRRGGSCAKKWRPLKRRSYESLVDPELPAEEARRVRRILSNRLSARRSRKRKATQIAALKEELAEARQEQSRLAVEVASLRAQLAAQAGGPSLQLVNLNVAAAGEGKIETLVYLN